MDYEKRIGNVVLIHNPLAMLASMKRLLYLNVQKNVLFISMRDLFIYLVILARSGVGNLSLNRPSELSLKNSETINRFLKPTSMSMFVNVVHIKTSLYKVG